MEFCEVVKLYEQHIKLLHQFLESEIRTREVAEKNLDTMLADHRFNQQQLRLYQSEHMDNIRRRRDTTLLQAQTYHHSMTRAVSQPNVSDTAYLEPIHTYDVVDC